MEATYHPGNDMTNTDTIHAAETITTTAILAHIEANPNQTQSQICYLAGAEGVLNAALSTLAALPIEKRPYIAFSSEIRHRAVRGLFALLIESGAIVRTGWRGGSAVYRAA